jgi:hypothetical protein
LSAVLNESKVAFSRSRMAARTVASDLIPES